MGRSTKMLIEAGIIPKNTLQQMALWRLVPEDFVELHGRKTTRLDPDNPTTVDRFIGDLGRAIGEDMAAIRETELDRPGRYADVNLYFKDGRVDAARLFVDQLGRIIVPVDPQWETLEYAVVESGSKRKVVRQETRYEGERPSVQVVYLEKE